jgi:hypothetical protein
MPETKESPSDTTDDCASSRIMYTGKSSAVLIEGKCVRKNGAPGSNTT